MLKDPLLIIGSIIWDELAGMPGWLGQVYLLLAPIISLICFSIILLSKPSIKKPSKVSYVLFLVNSFIFMFSLLRLIRFSWGINCYPCGLEALYLPIILWPTMTICGLLNMNINLNLSKLTKLLPFLVVVFGSFPYILLLISEKIFPGAVTQIFLTIYTGLHLSIPPFVLCAIIIMVILESKNFLREIKQK